jgi:8-oxo-dGTP pyrophosphatase MutT (NUDIX family)
MQRKIIQSYGIIPIYHSSDGDKILLVEQYSAQGTHWGFPKGKKEAGERPIDTAVREAREEVGLVFTEVDTREHFTERYSFTFENTIVDKTVTYYIGFVGNPGIAMREKEIKNAGWYTAQDVVRKLTYLNTRKIFDDAMMYLETHEKNI